MNQPHDPYHPTGRVLPAILRRTLPPKAPGGGDDERNDRFALSRIVDCEDDDDDDANWYWTADALEEALPHAALQLSYIQNQIQRGEECYTEEASTHSIYKGWDGFIDARLDSTFHNSASGNGVLGSGGGGGAMNTSLPPPRRMPAEQRWFSNSFTDLAPYSGPQANRPMGRFVPLAIQTPTMVVAQRTAAPMTRRPKASAVAPITTTPLPAEAGPPKASSTTAVASPPGTTAVASPPGTAAPAPAPAPATDSSPKTTTSTTGAAAAVATTTTNADATPKQPTQMLGSVPRKRAEKSSSLSAAAAAITVQAAAPATAAPAVTSTTGTALGKRKAAAAAAAAATPPLERRTRRRK
jgi:hypothetical protein